MNDKVVFYMAGVASGIMAILVAAKPLTKVLNALSDKLESKVG